MHQKEEATSNRVSKYSKDPIDKKEVYKKVFSMNAHNLNTSELNVPN